MTMNDKNLAYDFSLFEVQPNDQKTDNVIELPRTRKKSRVSLKFFNLAFVFFSVVVGASIVSVMIYGQVRLTELTDKINIVTKSLDESQSIHTQLEMKVESQLSLKAVEDYAEEELEMRRTLPSQVEYISLFEGDKAECESSERNVGILEKVRDIFLNLK